MFESSALLHRLADKLRAEGQRPFREYPIRQLGEQMASMVAEEIPETEAWHGVELDNIAEKLTPLQQVAYLARTFFDCGLFVVSEKSNA